MGGKGSSESTSDMKGNASKPVLPGTPKPTATTGSGKPAGPRTPSIDHKPWPTSFRASDEANARGNSQLAAAEPDLPEKQTSEDAGLSNEELLLASVLERLNLESDAAEASSSDIVEQDIKPKVEANLRAGKTAKKALEPLLETFDLEGIASYIKKGKAKRIIVMCGAGISVNAGIPDFRSPKTGLYENLQKYNLPHPQAVFELDYFRQKPQAFYQLAKELFPGKFKPTAAHYFMTLLEQKGLLLRVFSQNIDSLEREAGLPAERLVAAHGNFDTAHCIACKREVPLEVVRQAVEKEEVCRCPDCGGYVKPDIVFFGENLPERYFVRAEADFPKADLLIVMGTSLVVNPFASLIDDVKKDVPRVLINLERAGEADAALMLLGYRRGFQFDKNHRDALHLGDCDEGVRKLVKSLGWESEFTSLMSANQQNRTKL